MRESFYKAAIVTELFYVWNIKIEHTFKHSIFPYFSSFAEENNLFNPYKCN